MDVIQKAETYSEGAPAAIAGRDWIAHFRPDPDRRCLLCRIFHAEFSVTRGLMRFDCCEPCLRLLRKLFASQERRPPNHAAEKFKEEKTMKPHKYNDEEDDDESEDLEGDEVDEDDE